MKDVEIFLVELADSDRIAQAQARAGFRAPANFKLPRELAITFEHRCRIAPMLARSAYVSHTAHIGVPASDRDQIQYWAANHRDANWELTTAEEPGVVALDLDTHLARHSLGYIHSKHIGEPPHSAKCRQPHLYSYSGEPW